MKNPLTSGDPLRGPLNPGLEAARPGLHVALLHVALKTGMPARLVFLVLAISAPAMGEGVYVSQSGAGDGASCASPRSASWFNTASSWATPKQAGKIGPGDKVYLCGAFVTSLSLQGSGSSGSPVTVD